jgi:hypothetical protein
VVRREGDRYVCVLCGAILDMRLHGEPRSMIVQSTDGPRFRVILVDNDEIHRCPVDPDPRR